LGGVGGHQNGIGLVLQDLHAQSNTQLGWDTYKRWQRRCLTLVARD
jgi:hypothetical protein